MNTIFMDIDPKANYILTDRSEKAEMELFNEATQEYTDLDMVDYFIDGNADKDIDPKLPLSFSRCNSVDDGIEYYTGKHPELCDDIIAMISRSQFGNLPIKNARQKKIKEDDKFNVETRKIKISFD